eukprot:1161164-Pelagomonas_calceolata.AAC.3
MTHLSMSSAPLFKSPWSSLKPADMYGVIMEGGCLLAFLAAAFPRDTSVGPCCAGGGEWLGSPESERRAKEEMTY